MVDTRKDREKALQDARFKINDGSRGVERIYAITSESHGYFKRRIADLSAGKRALEFGCGNGANALELCQSAQFVAGIDISDVAVEIGTRRAEEAGISNVRFDAMDAEDLQFPDNSFEVICGVGILHHLDLNRAYAELARTLSPKGSAIFIEPLGYNPFINLFRFLTPKIRTPDEHPFLMRDLNLAKRFFRKLDIRYYYLTTLLAMPFARSAFGQHAVRTGNAVDKAIFSAIPWLRRYAWFVVMEMGDPIKQGAEGEQVGTLKTADQLKVESVRS
jgi:ubiquinone/menaquinone biosynthesis C-methylase UbiE